MNSSMYHASRVVMGSGLGGKKEGFDRKNKKREQNPFGRASSSEIQKSKSQ